MVNHNTANRTRPITRTRLEFAYKGFDPLSTLHENMLHENILFIGRMGWGLILIPYHRTGKKNIKKSLTSIAGPQQKHQNQELATERD